MDIFQGLVSATHDKFESWLATTLPRIGTATGIGVTAWSIGATLAQLAIAAQTTGWGSAITALSAELGKEFIVGLVERIRDQKLSEEDVARIVQQELDTGRALPDLNRLLEEVGTLPATVEHIVRLHNAGLLESLQADLAAYPHLISDQTAAAVHAALASDLRRISDDIHRLDVKSERILASLMATPHLAPEPNAEPPLLVFVSSVISELVAERQTVRQAVTSLGLAKPWVFESTPASAQPLEASYLDKVRACDFFVLLVGENVSAAVEKEFDTALAYHKPIVAFLKGGKDDAEVERTPAATAFISRIPTKWTTFSDPVDLALQARVALTDEVIRRVRADLIGIPNTQVQQLELAGSNLSRSASNLPARRYTHFVGREVDLTTLLEKLRASDPAAPLVIAITGLGGIGKTALAYEIVERVLVEGLFEGMVWESAKSEELRGASIVNLPAPSPLSLESLVRAIAAQLGFYALLQLPPNELYDRVRRKLQMCSYLIVVDNLDTITAYREVAYQLHELLSPSQSRQPSRALLTSRERLIDIPYIYDHYIGGLLQSASMEFLQQEARVRGATPLLAAGQELLNRVYDVTDGMPLAMKLIISQFLAGIPLDTELERLKGATKEEDLYKFIYLGLWFRLSIPAQKVLIAAAAFSSSVARFMLQPVSKTTDDEFETAIPELVRMSLIEPSEHATAADRRYSIHAVTRWFIKAPLRDLWEQQKARSQAP